MLRQPFGARNSRRREGRTIIMHGDGSGTASCASHPARWAGPPAMEDIDRATAIDTEYVPHDR